MSGSGGEKLRKKLREEASRLLRGRGWGGLRCECQRMYVCVCVSPSAGLCKKKIKSGLMKAGQDSFFFVGGWQSCARQQPAGTEPENFQDKECFRRYSLTLCEADGVDWNSL